MKQLISNLFRLVPVYVWFLGGVIGVLGCDLVQLLDILRGLQGS